VEEEGGFPIEGALVCVGSPSACRLYHIMASPLHAWMYGKCLCIHKCPRYTHMLPFFQLITCLHEACPFRAAAGLGRGGGDCDGVSCAY